jgi:hypothetical protein
MSASRPLTRLVLATLLPLPFATLLPLVATATADAAADAASGAAAPERNDRMGVATHFGNPGHYIENWNIEKLIPRVVELGVGWIRDDFYWSGYEKQKGVYAIPPRARQWIDTAHAAGLKINLVFNGGNKLYKNPYDPAAYAAAAARLARELAGKVQCIEILNEPHNFGFSKTHGGTWNGLEPDGSLSPWVSRYVTLLNTAAPAIKAANPAVKVIGLGSVPPVNFRQLAMGIAPQVDGLVDHPYSLRSVPEIIPYAASPGMLKRDGIATADTRGTLASQIRLYRETSARHNGPREIWLTEWGFPAYQESRPSLFAGFTREAQARYSLRRYMETFGLGIDLSVIYALKDDGKNVHDAEHNFGLLTPDDTPKPVFAAVQRLAHYMRPWHPPAIAPEIKTLVQNTRIDEWPVTWDGSRLAAPGAVCAWPFTDGNGKSMIAVWSAERAGGDQQPRLADIEILADWPSENIRACDLLTGEIRPLQAERHPGRLLLKAVSIPDHPVAIEFR